MNRRRVRLARSDLLAIAGGLVVAAALAWVLWIVTDLRNDRDALVDQVERLGATPVVEPAPPGERGEQGKQGERGRPGADAPPPTDTQVRRAVNAYCADNDCRGQKGEAGKSVTPQQVAAAVAGYCNANGECKGPQGGQGEPGEDGADSTVPGPQGDPGPPPTAEQIAAAVAAYCADDQCRGPAGAPGEDGQDGRGIQSGPDFVTSDGRCVARTTYTDGTTYESPAGSAACLLQ